MIVSEVWIYTGNFGSVQQWAKLPLQFYLAASPATSWVSPFSTQGLEEYFNDRDDASEQDSQNPKTSKAIRRSCWSEELGLKSPSLWDRDA